MPAARRFWSLFAALAVAAPASGHAFTQFKTATGAGMRWHVLELPYLLDDTGLQGLAPGKVQKAIRDSFGAWSQVQCTLCSAQQHPACPPVACAAHPLGVTFVDQGYGPVGPVGPGCARVEGDTCKQVVANGNHVLFVKQDADWLHGSSVQALTSVTRNLATGEVIDADIELNAAAYSFCIDDCAPNELRLRNTVTHEVGHFLGLDHSEEPDATMFGGAVLGESLKEDLHADDVTGICTAYRTKGSATDCPTDSGNVDPGDGGCQAGTGTAAGSGLAGLLLGATALLLGRRCKS